MKMHTTSITKNMIQSLWLLSLLSTSAQAAQLDLMPDDYVVKPDAWQLTIGLYDRRQTGPYVSGKIPNAKVGPLPFLGTVPLASTEISSEIVSLRVSKFTEIYGVTVAPVLAVSYRKIENTSASFHPTINMQNILGDGAEGVRGDASVGITAWLLNDQENHEYIAGTFLATLPTGEYDASKNINLSENRYKFVLGGGWHKPIGEGWISEFYPEIAWYGDNDAFRDYTKPKYFNPFFPTRKVKGQESFSQNATYAITETLRYKLTPEWQLFATGQINRGGKTYVNNIEFSGNINTTRLSAGALYYPSPNQQIMLRYTKDTDIDNGLRLADEITLRYMHYF